MANEMNNNQQINSTSELAVRREKLNALYESGKNPFEITKYEVSHESADAIKLFEEKEPTLAEGETITVNIAGRMVGKRVMGKASFAHLLDGQGRIQLYVARDSVGEEDYASFKKWDIGDIIGIEGHLFRTRTGEVSVHATKITLLAKSLLPLPEKFHGLTDIETRYRQRYVDLIVNPEVKRNFIIRSQFIKFMRNYLDERGYIEVETPVLNTIVGGAAARPFITHHNTLDIDMYMRIATELPLKRLIVGGMERVYEIGRIFRNEGMDPKHNPEFTSIELYEAYADFHDMMDIAEGIISGAAMAIHGTYELEWMGEKIDLTPGWRRLTMVDAVKEYAGVDFGAITDDAEAVKAAGAVGVMLNHAEKPIDMETLEATIKRADEVGLATIVCADTVEDVKRIAKMGPNLIVAEPTDLIGTGTTSDSNYVIETINTVREINPDIMVLQGAGISNGQDVYNTIKLGAQATGSTSGILKAADPYAMVEEMLYNLRKAWDELHP